MYKVIHYVYRLIGHVLAFFSNIWFTVRDAMNPPKEKAVLFIAHPDDDTLFFHSFIKEHKPYVVLLTTGGVIKRYLPFRRAMHYYGVRYRSFDMSSRAIDCEKRITYRIHSVLQKGEFEVCATHNAEGEYGHIMHQCIHRCVKDAWNGNLMVPYDRVHIIEHPLQEDVLREKQKAMKEIYSDEYPTLLTFEIWIKNEALTDA